MTSAKSPGGRQAADRRQACSRQAASRESTLLIALSPFFRSVIFICNAQILFVIQCIDFCVHATEENPCGVQAAQLHAARDRAAPLLLKDFFLPGGATRLDDSRP